MFVLDTNTLVYFFKRQGRVKQPLEAVPAGEICIPTVVLYELKVGLAKSVSPERRTRQIEQILKRAHIAVFDEEAAAAAALIRADLERKGTPIGKIDTLIAGTAVSMNATLVTHNTREFCRVAGLKLVDWF